jgi:anti-sigma B factor antagonist
VTEQPDTEFVAGFPTIVLEGEVDLAVAPGLQEKLDSLMNDGSATIVVDLDRARFLDSIALGVLVGTLERCRDAGGNLHLIVTDPRILKVLDITGLSNAFRLHSSRTELESGESR